MVLIIIDGLDASGKSTQAENLYDRFKKSHKTVYLRVHPSDDNFFGTEARHFLYQKGKSAHFASAFFYMVDVIRSILIYSWQKYDCIIFVRYLDGNSLLTVTNAQNHLPFLRVDCANVRLHVLPRRSSKRSQQKNPTDSQTIGNVRDP